jgi:hypothetical protein
MRKPRRNREDQEAELEAQREARKAASTDPNLREQTKTETEQRPYLDTEGGD